jgi:hypothetical protein
VPPMLRFPTSRFSTHAAKKAWPVESVFTTEAEFSKYVVCRMTFGPAEEAKQYADAHL